MGAKELMNELENEEIVIKAGSLKDLIEEAPFVYKGADDVVEVVHRLELAAKITRLKPLAVVKG